MKGGLPQRALPSTSLACASWSSCKRHGPWSTHSIRGSTRLFRKAGRTLVKGHWRRRCFPRSLPAFGHGGAIRTAVDAPDLEISPDRLDRSLGQADAIAICASRRNQAGVGIFRTGRHRLGGHLRSLFEGGGTGAGGKEQRGNGAGSGHSEHALANVATVALPRLQRAQFPAFCALHRRKGRLARPRLPKQIGSET